jgi:hypothetical protein
MGLIMIISSLQYEIREIAHHNDQKVKAFKFLPTFAFIAVATTSIEGVLTVLPCRSSMKIKKVIHSIFQIKGYEKRDDTRRVYICCFIASRNGVWHVRIRRKFELNISFQLTIEGI